MIAFSNVTTSYNSYNSDLIFFLVFSRIIFLVNILYVKKDNMLHTDECNMNILENFEMVLLQAHYLCATVSNILANIEPCVCICCLFVYSAGRVTQRKKLPGRYFQSSIFSSQHSFNWKSYTV